MGIDSENHLFRNLPKALSCKIESSIYNRRKRRLSEQINSILAKITAQTLNQYIIKIHLNRNINKLKTQII